MRTLMALVLIAVVSLSVYFLRGQPETEARNEDKNVEKKEEKEVGKGRAREISSKDLLVVENIKLLELDEKKRGKKNKKEIPEEKSERAVLTDAERRIVFADQGRFQRDTLVLLAELSSPIWERQKLQASDLYINQFGDNKMIYVSYNMRGEPFLGGIQVLKIDGENNQAELLQTVVFTDFDIHSLTEKNGVLYLAGSSGDPAFKTPAALEIINLKNGLIELPLESARVDLPSFAATSVIKVKDKIYVATGNQNGGIVELDAKKSIKNGITHYLDLEHTLFDLDDARYLDYDEKNIYAVKGTDAGLWIYDRKKKSAQELELQGATIPESKSTVEIAGNKLLLALGDGGTQILDLKSLKILHSVPQAEHYDMSLSVTNAASGHFKEVYTADGEAGASVFQFSENGELQHLAGISFGAKRSVNAIKYFDGHLVMATGLGGVKVAKLFRKDSKVQEKEYKHYMNELKKRLADD